jgi:hypothetical protein
MPQSFTGSNLAFVIRNPPWSLILTAYILWFSRIGLLKVKFSTWYCLIDRQLWCRILKPQNIMKLGCPSDWYTAFRDSYLSTISNKLSLNPCYFNCCHSPWSQLYALSKFCKNRQHTYNSVPHGHHSYAWTRGIMNNLRWSDTHGRSWSTHFSVSHVRSWGLVTDRTVLMSWVLQTRLVEFKVCWLKLTPNFCINNVLRYEY